MASPPVRRRRRSRYTLTPSWFSPRRVVALLTAAVLLVGVVYVARVAIGLGKVFHTNPLSAIVQVVKGKSDSQLNQPVRDLKRINIALYGYGGSGHDGAFLSDSIMVVSIQPQASGPAQVAEISIPRDWFVPIDLGNGKTTYGRINEAYSDGQAGAPASSSVYKGDQGGGQLANHELETLLGIHIDHFVGIDFYAFRDIVDSVNGIDVNVPNTFTDYSYPRGECNPDGTGDCHLMTVHFDKGMQHMDGTTALEFARSRHAAGVEGTDFARSKRQQLVIAAVKQKVFSLGGIGNLPSILNSLGDNVITDLSIGDAEVLYDLVKDVPTASITHVSIDDQNFLYECGYPTECSAAYLYPRDRSLHSLQHLVQNVLPPEATLAEHAPVTIQDGSGFGNGASGRWSGILGQLGFSTQDGGPTAVHATTHVVDLSGGRYAKTAQWLAQYYGVPVDGPPPAPSGAAAGTPPAQSGVLVVLGQDEEQGFNNRTQNSVYGAALYTGGGSQSTFSQPTLAAVRATPVPTAVPTARPTATPSPTPRPTVTPGPTPKPTPKPTGAPSPTP